MSPCLLYFSALFLLLFFHIPTCNAENPLRVECNNTYDGITAANYTVNSTFHTNLKILLPSLSFSVSLTKGFYNTSIGQGLDRVYGLVLCRGDATPEACRNCTAFASDGILSLCKSRSSAIWYDLCQLQYSDTNFFNLSTTIWWFWVWSTINITDPDVETFMAAGRTLMVELAYKAAYEPWRGMFATGESSYSWTPTVYGVALTKNIYGLVQCKPVISGAACHGCLQDAIGFIRTCCDSVRGGRVIGEVCSLRFEDMNFFGDSLVAGLAPSPPLPPSSTNPTNTGRERNNNSSRIIVILIPAIAVAIILFIIVVFLRIWKKKTYSQKKRTDTSAMDQIDGSAILLQIDFETIKVATDDFSDENKLGVGGFGVVYKGVLLADGKEIAVKRLSINSGQGLDEFMNEVEIIAKLHHKNLVRLYGYCVEVQEKLLVYEYIPNGSLDYFLFDPERRPSLDWECRFKIIGGISRGLLYLHEDSRFRIIHRDLKASNILLDANMIPKISDFGMAKIFGGDQTSGNTRRIAGTFGYMAPEYGMHGQFSVKSDVYSFGVLLLEIITGL